MYGSLTLKYTFQLKNSLKSLHLNKIWLNPADIQYSMKYSFVWLSKIGK